MPTSSPKRPRRRRLSLLDPCASPDILHAWVKQFTGLNIPRTPVCDGHDSPFDYLSLAYFEPTRDLVVWAPRGGGKTRLAALATLLDLLHKPPVAVRILGGSLEQSLRMWEHLLPDLESLVPKLLGQRRSASRRIELTSGASAAVLTQSQRAVRGLRVQKLRCDEVEMFKPEIWNAAQLVTRSRPGKSSDAIISGAIEAISTLHAPYGLMSRIIENATRTGTRVLHWCLLDVLERCHVERPCQGCVLWDECRGVAKSRCDGFISIEDAIAMKKRVGAETWDCEMLCRRPNVRGCVFPTFDADVHVREMPAIPHEQVAGSNAVTPSSSASNTAASSFTLAIDFGFANPFVCLWIEARDDGSTFVVDEYIQPMRTVDEHLQHIQQRQWPKTRRICCDPAGGGRNDQTAASNIQLLRSAGYVVKTRRSFIVQGLELIRAALRPAIGGPRLFIHPRCLRLIKAMQSYRYPEGGGELPIKDGEYDHPIDALRYYFVNTAQTETAAVRTY